MSRWRAGREGADAGSGDAEPESDVVRRGAGQASALLGLAPDSSAEVDEVDLSDSAAAPAGGGAAPGRAVATFETETPGSSRARMSLAQRYHMLGLGPVLFSSKLNWLLVSVPITFLAALVGWKDMYLFCFSLVSLIPLAAMMGYITEQLSLRTTQTIGGLLNASFGNATELIIALFALKHDLLRIIQQSLLGSMLSNMLLILGSAFLLGGVTHHEQTFNRTLTSTCSGLLMLSVMGLAFPTVLHNSNADTETSELHLSRATAVIMLFMYAAYLVFQLRTHSDLFQELGGEREHEEVVLSKKEAIFWLLAITVLVSVLSEFLVGAIEGASRDAGIPQIFIGAILLPIVSNAAEHVTAISAAYKDKMNLCLGVAIGSSTQIALFGVPFMVVAGWIADKPLSLYFRPYETSTVFVSTIIVAFLTSEGRSNWLTGLMLCAAYAIVAAGFLFHLDDQDEDL